MDDQLRAACPECGTIYRFRNRQSIGRKMTCRHCGDAFVARLQTEELEPEVEEEDSSQDELPPPVRGSRRASRTSSPHGRRKIDRRLWAVAALLIVVGLGVAMSAPLGQLFNKARQFSRTGRISDSPESVYTDLASAMRDIRNTADSIRDRESRHSAIQKFKDMKPRFAELQVRACLLEPIPEQEFKDLFAKHKDALQLERKDAKQISQRISDSGQGGIDLLAVVAEVANEYHAAADMLHEGLKQPVEPKNAADKFEYDELQIKRKLVRRIATTGSAAEMDAVATDARTAAASIEELAPQRPATEPGAADNRGKYAEYRSATNFLVERIRHVIETRYGKHDGLRQALVAVQLAEDGVVNPLPKGWTRKIFTNPVAPAATNTNPVAPKKEGFGLE